MMDFFKFTSTGEATNLDQGQQINGIKKSTWVERYSVPGEFKFEAPLSSGLREFLPKGTIISHADTLELMIVENHLIKESKVTDPILEISGRGFTSWLENRMIGVNTARSLAHVVPFVVGADYSWNQIVDIINHHIIATYDSDDELEDVIAVTTMPGTGVSEERTIQFGNVLERITELLAIDDLGIMTIRKNTFGVGTAGNTTFVIHKGVNRSSTVFMSWKSGDLAAADYLFTNKSDKNSAMVIGQYVYVVVDTGPTGYERRMGMVDATDIDRHLSEAPLLAELAAVMAAMETRGRQALRAQKEITLSQTDISANTKYQYRRDYGMGDLITLDGNFGQMAVMRVVEYAEIEDENGESGHPTLAIPGA